MESRTGEESVENLPDQTAERKPEWITWSSLSTMAMAMITAVGILLSSVAMNEFFLERTTELVKLPQLSVARISIEMLESKHEILASLGETIDEEEIRRVAKYREEEAELEAAIAREDEISLSALMERRLFAIGVALLSIATTMSAASIVVVRKNIWVAGLVFGALGTGFATFATYTMLTS